MSGVGNCQDGGITPGGRIAIREGLDCGLGFRKVTRTDRNFVAGPAESCHKTHPKLSRTTDHRNFHKNKSFSRARKTEVIPSGLSFHSKPRTRVAGVFEVFPIDRPAAAASASTAASVVARNA